MNITVYLFGNLKNGYTQYPDDYSKNIFKKFEQESKATTQIAIHRDGDLMYYGYVRKLEDSNYIGICVIINGKIITDFDELFRVYERAIESMVRHGYLIHFTDNGEIGSKVSRMYENREEIDQITSILRASFDRLEITSRHLPPVSYSASKDSVKNYSVQDKNSDIVRSSYTNGYTFVYKSKDYDTAQMNTYKGILIKKDKEIKALQKEKDTLKTEVRSLRNMQRNTLWVSIFALAAFILGVVVWNQVLFPSEVTKKDMGEFMYYGPMENGEPNGIGVAIYHDDDKDGRLYYYGKFTSGKRVDDSAIMFYKDGSYFRGSMNEDKWFKGVFYDIENEHFVGEFNNNEPYNGTWYKHVKSQTVTNGE